MSAAREATHLRTAAVARQSHAPSLLPKTLPVPGLRSTPCQGGAAHRLRGLRAPQHCRAEPGACTSVSPCCRDDRREQKGRSHLMMSPPQRAKSSPESINIRRMSVWPATAAAAPINSAFASAPCCSSNCTTAVRPWCAACLRKTSCTQSCTESHMQCENAQGQLTTKAYCHWPAHLRPWPAALCTLPADQIWLPLQAGMESLQPARWLSGLGSQQQRHRHDRC
jgi:hypothetical protein